MIIAIGGKIIIALNAKKVKKKIINVLFLGFFRAVGEIFENFYCLTEI